MTDEVGDQIFMLLSYKLNSELQPLVTACGAEECPGAEIWKRLYVRSEIKIAEVIRAIDAKIAVMKQTKNMREFEPM